MSALNVVSEGIQSNVTATRERDYDRETSRWAMALQFRNGTKRLDSFESFGEYVSGSPENINELVSMCWGPFAFTGRKEKGPDGRMRVVSGYVDPYDLPFNGGDVPEQFRIYKPSPMGSEEPTGRSVPSSNVKTKRDSETVSTWGEKALVVLADHPNYPAGLDKPTTRDFSYTWETVTYAIPAGTVPSKLSRKGLARLMWGVYQSLPRALKGADRSKLNATARIILGDVQTTAKGPDGQTTVTVS